LPPGQRLERWVADLSDLRISIYMLIMALMVVALLLLVDRRLFA